MTYRFAHAAFWAALALAGEEAIGWGRVKGLYLRHLRHWSTRPIAHEDGVLSLGYGFPSERLLEPYSSPGSPYWAMKAFLALAAPDDHPFWQAEEAPLEPAAPVTQVQPGFVIARDDEQTLAVAAGQPAPEWVSEVAAKYQRFAYSSRFGFTRSARARGPERGFGDSTMWLTDAGGVTQARDSGRNRELHDELLAVTWRPWPDVWVDTVLWVAAPWHGRLHRIRTARPLQVHESGFALGLPASRVGDDLLLAETEAGSAVATSTCGRAGILDPAAIRLGRLVRPDQGANLEWPDTVVPVLDGEVEAGTQDLATLVFGSGPAGLGHWASVPAVPDAARALLERRAPRWSGRRAALNGLAARATGTVSPRSSQPVTMPPLSSSARVGLSWSLMASTDGGVEGLDRVATDSGDMGRCGLLEEPYPVVAQDGEHAPTVGRAGFARDETGVGEAVDAVGEAAA